MSDPSAGGAPAPGAGCPDDATALAFLEGALPPPARAALLAHVDGCADCRALLSALAGAPSLPPRAPGPPPPASLGLSATIPALPPPPPPAAPRPATASPPRPRRREPLAVRHLLAGIALGVLGTAAALIFAFGAVRGARDDDDAPPEPDGVLVCEGTLGERTGEVLVGTGIRPALVARGRCDVTLRSAVLRAGFGAPAIRATDHARVRLIGCVVEGDIETSGDAVVER